MELSRLKRLTVPEGEVEDIRIGDTLIWDKYADYDGGVEITTDNSEPITGLLLLQNASITFTADYHVPEVHQSKAPTWTIEGLPAGMTAESLNEDSLTVSGYPESSGDFTVTVSVKKWRYTNKKIYTLTVTHVDYGVSITTSNDSAITDFALNKSASKTFAATFNVPSSEQDSAVTWSFTNLPSGLSASGSTVSGIATTPGNKTVTVKVTKGSYSTTKTFTFAVYGIAISNTRLPSITYNYNGCNYSATLAVTKNLPSDTGSVTYYASGLPSGLSLNSSTGVISGTPASAGTSTVSVYAKQGAYTSATKSLELNIWSPPAPTFNPGSHTLRVYAADVRSSDFVNQNVRIFDMDGSATNGVTTVPIYGSGFSSVTFIENTVSVALHGSSTASTPVIQVNASIVSDTQINLTFKLTKKTTTTQSSLANRGTTLTAITVKTYTNSSASSYFEAIVELNIGMAWL